LGVNPLATISEEVIKGLGALHAGPILLQDNKVKFDGVEQLPVRLYKAICVEPMVPDEVRMRTLPDAGAIKLCHVELIFPVVQQLGVVAGSEAEPVQAVLPFTLTSKSIY
jgi:hypothetical protein